jgi:hypothetical protein|tara:strand:+ start:60 stop:266 length:207 start_codon:yes stop_codon:yes gene_type:complete
MSVLSNGLSFAESRMVFGEYDEWSNMVKAAVMELADCTKNGSMLDERDKDELVKVASSAFGRKVLRIW